jgi:gliding motility-associated-like protein
MKTPLTLILLCCALHSLSATFTVTSNADSGPGTLRDALQQAAANGSATPDQIVFNIVDQSRAGRTITLLTSLPALSSSLTIDGTTQPGTPFGISNAEVIIQFQYNPAGNSFILFQAFSVSNIAIYGLELNGANSNSYALHFRDATNIQFGAAGKGNIVQGFENPFNCDFVSGTDPISSNIAIQGNIMGIDETGSTISGTTLNGVTFYFENVSNLQIGGLSPGQGNLMVEENYPMYYTWTRQDNFGYLNIEGNTIGTDKTGLIELDPFGQGFEIDGADDGNANVTGTTNLKIQIINNVSAVGFAFSDISSPFLIQGNHLGLGPDNTTRIAAANASYFLDFEDCGQGLIGGTDPADKNWVYNTPGYGVLEFWCSNITISRNSFACNGIGITYNWLLTRPAPFVTINTLSAGSVGGTSLPESTVELFYDDECPGCEGKTYIGTTTADNNGNWTYGLTATGAIVATATDIYGATSPFSTATINTDKIVVQNATCGRNNGSIKNIQVTSGTEWYWQDAAGNIVGNSTDLVNVGPGVYTFVTSIGGASCAATSTPYTITDVALPIVDPNNITITQPGCGQNNGALQYQSAFDPIASYIWLKGGDVVCPDVTTTNPFGGIAPGSYILQVALNQDPNCFAQYGPFVLTNQTGPSLDVSGLQIVSTTCGRSNGSISGITWQNATGAVYLGWEDSVGHPIATGINLVNVPAGLYRLAFKDGGTCDTLFTNYYRITDVGTITFDTSKMEITASNCDATNGAITGISSTNATTFAWSNGANTEDLGGLAAGTYTLVFSNGLGCETQTPGLVVAQVSKPAVDYSALEIVDDTCNSGQGAILDLTMVDPGRTYTWAWYTGAAGNGSPGGGSPGGGSPGSGTSQAAGNTAGYLSDLKAGDYFAIITDQYNCPVTSNAFAVADIELATPAPQVSDQYIPRNTATVIPIGNPQEGVYQLLDNNVFGATVLSESTTGSLQTPPIPQDETFYVGFTRGDCISALSAVNIKVFDSVKLYVPNAFTPNNDGVNDRWHIIVQGLVRSIRISVFDRWGAEVFASSSVNASWDGTFGGRLLSGTFAYIITGTDYYNRPIRMSGTVLIVR